MDQESQNEIKKGKLIDLEITASRILLFIIFLLPLFALPFGIFAVDFSKAMFLYTGVSVVTIFFLVGRINKRSIVFPKSFLLLSMFLVAGAWFVASIFSGNAMISLIGAGYETSTFVFFLFLAVVSFLISALFSSAKQLVVLYRALFVSALILFVVQFLHTGFGVAIPPWEIFQGSLASVLGSWNDLGIFFGLISIISLSCLEFGEGNKRERIFLWLTLSSSLVAVFFINFSTMQYVLGFSVLAVLVYHLIRPPHFDEFSHEGTSSFFNLSFFVFFLIVIFAVAHNWIGGFVTFLGIQFTQVNPSWTATFDVVGSVISSNPIFGSGPNTFLYDWSMFKPSAISNTIFWDARFISGLGKLPSMFAEVGLIGATTLIIFISTLLYAGKAVISQKEHSLERMLVVSSFLGSVYLWTFTIVYTPGFLIFVFAGIFTGIFIAALGLNNVSPFIELEFTRNTRKGLMTYSLALIVALGFICSIYVFGTKYLAGYFYTSALKEASTNSDFDKASIYLKKAVWLDPQDVYFRSSAEVGLLRLGQVISRVGNTEAVSETERTKFNSILRETVQSSKNATIENPLDPENWMELGRVYESLLQLDPKAFKSSAIFAYEEALRVSPKNPTPLLALARIELQTGNTEEALKYLNESLKIKNNFTDGYLMISDILVGKGKLVEAIAELEKTVVANPNNPDNIYIVLRVGVLYYQDGYYEKARTIFENLVSVNPNYIDARYALGLLYDKNGMREMAIAQFEAVKKLAPENNEVQTILDSLRSGVSLPIKEI